MVNSVLCMSLQMQNNSKQTSQKIVKQCKRILEHETIENIQKWTVQHKLSALTLRNVKAVEIINLSNYLLQKQLINNTRQQLQFLSLLVEYLKKNTNKCYEHAKLIKYYSEWDYQFQEIYHFALDQHLDQIGLYLRVREMTLKTDFLKSKKDLLSGVSTELENWANLAKVIFKGQDEEIVIDRFATVVKNHYVQVKKSQAENINGAEFLKICLIMSEGGTTSEEDIYKESRVNQKKMTVYPEGVIDMFDEHLLKGLSTQDKELIRVLSYKDKNIARMLEEKHTKMVYLIGEEVNELRKDIDHEKKRYVQVVEQKNMLVRLTERIKQTCLKYILQPQEHTQFELLRMLDSFNKKHNPRATDVAKTTEIINNRRLIQIIERQQLEKD